MLGPCLECGKLRGAHRRLPFGTGAKTPLPTKHLRTPCLSPVGAKHGPFGAKGLPLALSGKTWPREKPISSTGHAAALWQKAPCDAKVGFPCTNLSSREVHRFTGNSPQNNLPTNMRLASKGCFVLTCMLAAKDIPRGPIYMETSHLRFLTHLKDCRDPLCGI